jgi:predicted Zn-dependent protease
MQIRPRKLQSRYALALSAALAGCATPPEQASWPGWPEQSQRKAVASLMDQARMEESAGRLGNAAASMERAIRLAPRNPRLWQELARLRLNQRDYVQAEHVAMRSNTLSRGDYAIRAQNWNIIAQAREARGDTAGARSARALAKRVEY